MKSKKYFNRIFCTLVALTTFASLVFSLWFYISSQNKAKNEFYMSKQTSAAAASQKMEYIFEMCDKSAQAACADLNKLTPKSAQTVFSLGNLYIADEFSLLYKNENSPALDRSVFEKLTSVSADKKLFSFLLDGNEYIAFVNRIRTDEKKMFVMRSFEESEFLRLVGFGADTVVLFSDGAPMYIGNEKYCTDLKSHINESGVANTFLNVENGEYKGKNCVYISKRSEYFAAVNEMFAYSASELAPQRSELVLISVAVFFIFALAFAVISFFAAKIAYHPIDELNAFAARYTKNTGAEDEVAHVSSAIKEMENKIQIQISEMENDKKLLRERFVKDLLTGIVEEENYSEALERFSLDEYETPFYAGVFEISDYESLTEAFGERNLFQIKRQILSFISNELVGRSVQTAFEIDKKRFAVITCGCPLSKIRQNFSYIVSVVNAEFDVEMFAVIGSECDDLLNISESYSNCIKTLDDSAVFGFRSSVIVCDDIKTASAGFYYPVNIERDLISSVMRLKREESVRIINNILDENLNGKTLTKEKHNTIVFAFTSTVNRIVEALNKTTDEIYGEDNIIFLELKMCSDAGALRAKIIQIFEQIINYMSGSDDAALSQRLLDYIHSHYNEDISLTEIGEYFSKSKCYISTVFKEATGENFKDYLSRYRIKKAKEILIKNPDIKTKELASMIGCNTVATLFRLFNKYENMSPGQFVKNNEK